MMRKLTLAALISGLITWPATSIYFLFSYVMAVSNGQSTTDLVGQAFQGALVCWVIFTIVIYQIQGLFDDLNKARREDLERLQNKQKPLDHDDQDPKNRQ